MARVMTQAILDILMVIRDPYMTIELVYRYRIRPLIGVPRAMVRGRASFPRPPSCRKRINADY